MTSVKPEPRDGMHQITFAKDQSQYKPLEANVRDDQFGEVETKWKLSFVERLIVLFAGNIYLSLLTFGSPLQPINIRVTRDGE